MWNWMMLGLESNRVIGLRIAKLMRGGKAAQREAQGMVSEKVLAAAKAGTSLMAGASRDKIVEQYRRKVAANDTVWARCRATGIDPRSGKPVAIDVVDICRFSDGKLVEHWGVPDRFALLHQIGALPPPPKQI
jgi:ketosteroid isomerase-like protein